MFAFDFHILCLTTNLVCAAFFEQRLLDQVMHKVYGDYLLQLSVLNEIKLSRQSPVTHHFRLSPCDNKHVQTDLITQFETLAIKSASVDGVILHHVLEYSTHPHQLLNEVGRVIAPSGYLVLLGFNPFNALQIKKYLNCWSTQSHWRYHSFSVGRMQDWLRVLGFEPFTVRYAYHGLPFNRGHRSWLVNTCQQCLPYNGAAYMIMARKNVTPMNLIKPTWKKQSMISWIPTRKQGAKAKVLKQGPQHTSKS